MNIYYCLYTKNQSDGRRGRDRMVVEFTTTRVISAYHHKRCDKACQ
jgi:hypothetical protein